MVGGDDDIVDNGSDIGDDDIADNGTDIGDDDIVDNGGDIGDDDGTNNNSRDQQMIPGSHTDLVELDKFGNPDGLTLHTGYCPILKGSEWILKKFIRRL